MTDWLATPITPSGEFTSVKLSNTPPSPVFYIFNGDTVDPDVGRFVVSDGQSRAAASVTGLDLLKHLRHAALQCPDFARELQAMVAALPTPPPRLILPPRPHLALVLPSEPAEKRGNT